MVAMLVSSSAQIETQHTEESRDNMEVEEADDADTGVEGQNNNLEEMLVNINPAFKEEDAQGEVVEEEAPAEDVEEEAIEDFTEENFGLVGKFFKTISNLTPGF